MLSHPLASSPAGWPCQRASRGRSQHVLWELITNVSDHLWLMHVHGGLFGWTWAYERSAFRPAKPSPCSPSHSLVQLIVVQLRADEILLLVDLQFLQRQHAVCRWRCFTGRCTGRPSRARWLLSTEPAWQRAEQDCMKAWCCYELL